MNNSIEKKIRVYAKDRNTQNGKTISKRWKPFDLDNCCYTSPNLIYCPLIDFDKKEKLEKIIKEINEDNRNDVILKYEIIKM